MKKETLKKKLELIPPTLTKLYSAEAKRRAIAKKLLAPNVAAVVEKAFPRFGSRRSTRLQFFCKKRKFLSFKDSALGLGVWIVDVGSMPTQEKKFKKSYKRRIFFGVPKGGDKIKIQVTAQKFGLAECFKSVEHCNPLRRPLFDLRIKNQTS